MSNTQYPTGSINAPHGAHASYALNKVQGVAMQILGSDSATDNERALADCIIALNRSLTPYWVGGAQ